MVKKSTQRRRSAARSISPQPTKTATSTDTHQTSRGRIWRAAAHLSNSALDFALEHLWGVLAVALGGPIVTIVGAILLYFKSGRAAWLWPWVTHLLTFWIGVLFITAIIGVMAWRKNRKEKRERALLQDAKNLRFATSELGYVDFFANKEKAEAELAKVLIPINKEIVGLGKVAIKQVKRLKPNTSFSQRQKILAKTATMFNEHSQRVEAQWKIFEEIDDVLAESNVGSVNWLNPENEDHRLALLQQRQAAQRLLTTMEFSLPSLESFRDTVAAQKGHSQSLNTAVACLKFVMDGLIAALRKSERRWQNLIELIDKKIDL